MSLWRKQSTLRLQVTRKSVLQFTRILVSKWRKKSQEESVSSITSQLKITVTEVCWSGDDKAIGLGRLGTLGHNPRRNICDSRPDWGSARVQHKTRKLGGKTHVPYPNWMCSCHGWVKTVQMFKRSIGNKIDIKMIWINRISTCSASYGMINVIWEIKIVYYWDHKGTRLPNSKQYFNLIHFCQY